MQGSARAALVVAPALLGAFMTMGSPIELYRWLAILPLVSALLVWRLPVPSAGGALQRRAEGTSGEDPAVRRLAVVQFLFAFATVVTFPYFVEFARTLLPGLPVAID